MPLCRIRWFEEGSLSIEFKCKISNDDHVKAFMEFPEVSSVFPDGDDSGGLTIKVWLAKSDSTVVATGTASVGSSRITRVESHVFRQLMKTREQHDSSVSILKVGQKGASTTSDFFTFCHS